MSINTAALANLSQAELIAMLVAQAKSAERKLSLKVSEKGAVSLYGMGRFPVTLYGTQWERLIAHSAEISAFLTANASLLSTKD